MGFDKRQFEGLIIRVLTAVDPALASNAATNLLLGTAAQESEFGTYRRQLGGGPALGVFQMEPNTFNWLRDKYSHKYPAVLHGRTAEELEWDLFLSILTARLRYRVVPQALPSADSVQDLALYWKKHYNTPAGAGTIEQFEQSYARYVA